MWPALLRADRYALERPDSMVDGLRRGFIVGFELTISSICGVVVYPLRGYRAHGCWGALAALLYGVSSLFLGILGSMLLFIRASSEGLRTVLQHFSNARYTRPKRAFSADRAVRPFSFHASQASHLTRSAIRSVAPPNHQPVVAAYPLTCTSFKVSSDNLNSETTAHPVEVSDYLVLTPELVLYMRGGEARWVCRIEDISGVYVKVASRMLKKSPEAFNFENVATGRASSRVQASREALVRSSGQSPLRFLLERKIPVKNSGGVPSRLLRREYSRYSVATPATTAWTLQVNVKNSLKLPERVLRNPQKAYLTFFQKAAERNHIDEATKLCNVARVLIRRVFALEQPSTESESSMMSTGVVKRSAVKLPLQDLLLAPSLGNKKPGEIQKDFMMPQNSPPLYASHLAVKKWKWSRKASDSACRSLSRVTTASNPNHPNVKASDGPCRAKKICGRSWSGDNMPERQNLGVAKRDIQKPHAEVGVPAANCPDSKLSSATAQWSEYSKQSPFGRQRVRHLSWPWNWLKYTLYRLFAFFSKRETPPDTVTFEVQVSNWGTAANAFDAISSSLRSLTHRKSQSNV